MYNSRIKEIIYVYIARLTGGELELRATLKDANVKEGFAVKGSEVDDCDLALSA